MSRYFIETYGCQMNLADSETIGGVLGEAGWESAESVQTADLIVVNTCSVRERAAERAIGHLQSLATLKKSNPDLLIVMAGCLPQHRGNDLADQLPDVDLFVGPDNYRQLPEMLARERDRDRFLIRPNKTETYGDIRPLRDRDVNAWVSIMRGCDRCCTYCAVPLARGRERSLEAEAVIEATAEAVENGFASVTLLGQAVTSYRDGERDFTWLLERLSRIERLKRLWFLSPHPTDFTPELLTLIGERPVIARHLHLPLQAGANRVLEVMRRGYTREEYIALATMARKKIPGVSITTDIIVGFPGETEAEFSETVALMETVRFDSAFMFAYSPRERTYAARKLTDDVPDEMKKRRLREIIDLQESHSWERYRALIGKTVDVLVVGPSKASKTDCFGRAGDNRATVFKVDEGEMPETGSMVQVLVTDVTSHTLKGEVAPPP
jgi:tRNA-2-methylthio-N6-dimethylallyladenosine synthase